MKNIFKRAAAFAMAFTLLGAGTTITKTVSPKSDTTITADAARNTHAYRVKSRFAYGISMVYWGTIQTGTVLDFDVSGGNWVVNINIYEGTVLELDSSGKCISGYDPVSGWNWKGYYFNNYMHNLTKIY